MVHTQPKHLQSDSEFLQEHAHKRGNSLRRHDLGEFRVPPSANFQALPPLNIDTPDLSSAREDQSDTKGGCWGMGSAAADVSGNPICPCL